MDYLINKKKNIGMAAVYLFVMGYIMFFTPVISGDEVIKYWAANSMLNGAILYKDINILVPYLSLIFSYIVVSIFHNIIAIRVLNIIVFSLIFYFSHKIVTKYTNNNSLLFCANLLCLLYYTMKFFFYYDYNILSFMFALICLYILLNKKFTYKNAFILAMTGSCCILCKHTVGFLYFVALLICLFIQNKKKDIIFWKKIFFMFTIGVINIGIFITYLFWNDSFFDFYNLAFCGIGSFISNAVYEWMCVFLLIAIILIIGMFTLRKIIKWDVDDICILIFSMASLFICFPILDFAHFYPFLILSVIILNKNKNVIKRDYTYCVVFVSIIFLMIIGYVLNSDFSREINNNPYKYLLVDSFIENKSNYISHINEEYGNSYYINKFSVFESVYMNTSHGYYDLLWNGNTGHHSSLDYIKMLEKKTNYIIIDKNNVDYYQWDNKIIDYIKNTYLLIEQNDEFLVYKTK